MIPEEKREKIARRLDAEVGVRDDVGKFLYTFSALDVSRDAQYALDEIEHSTDYTYNKAINIVLEEILGV